MYIIKKTTYESSIIYMEYDDPAYKFTLDINRFKINNLYVYDKKYLPRVDSLLPFEYVFTDLANKVFGFLYSDEDDDEGDNSGRLISEVDKTREMLENQYKEFLKRQDYYMYLDKLSFLKDEIYNKIEINKYKQNINNLLSSRSR